MQRMTQEMGRLCKEISTGHKERQQLCTHLAEFHRGLQGNVGDMLGRLHKANADMFADARHTRMAFMHDLSNNVAAMRKAFHADLMGARRAWHG